MSDSTFISPTVQMAGVGAPSPTPTPVQSTPISVDTLGKGASTPINIPPPTPMTPVTHNVPPPTGTTTDANGKAIIPPPAKTSATDQLQGLIDKLGTKESVENDLNNKYQTDALLNAKTSDYNAYNQAKIDQTNKIAQMRDSNPEGQDKFGVDATIAKYQLESDAHISNLAIKSQLSSGLYTNAEDSITKKLDSIFSPIRDQASLLVEMRTMKNNDMTDSEKELAKLKSDKQTKDADNVQQASNDIQKTLLKNGNYSAVAPKIDKINQDFVDGKITASEAQSKMYESASMFNVSAGNIDNLVSPVVKLSDGTYDAATQKQLLSQFPPAEAALIEKIGNYDMDIAKVTSLAGGAREALAKKVALVFPDFQMQNYATIAAYKKNLANTTQGSAGGAINSANKVINHLTSYIDNVGKLSNGPIGGTFGNMLNASKNAVFSTFSPSRQTALAEANTDATGVKDELAKFFKGTGVADVHTIEDWSKTVNVNGSPAEQRGAIQGAIELLQGQLVPMIDQYKQTIGQEPPPGLFLKAETQQKLSNLKNQGYKIDIPGVNYTDINAYYKYGGGIKDDLINAQTELKANGIPVTLDNALQWAQIKK